MLQNASFFPAKPTMLCRSQKLRSLSTLAAVCLSLALALCLPSSAAGLDPQRPLTQALLRIWQAQQGLPRAAIQSICQTHEGYLWLGTQEGLYRFDGVRFVTIEGSGFPVLRRTSICALCEDQQHRLWIATDNLGLYCWQNGELREFDATKQLPSSHVNCLLLDRAGDLWIGTDQGLARWRQKTLTVYGAKQGQTNSSVRALGTDADGRVLIGVNGGQLLRCDGSTINPLKLTSLPEGSEINAVHAGGDSLWIGTTHGLIRQTGSDERLFTTADGLGDDLIYSVVPGSSGTICVGTKNGFCRLQGERVERFQTRDGLSQSTACALCEDHEGSLWVGTKHGLNQLVDRRTLLPFTVSEGLPSNETGPILQDSAGRVWVGTLDAGLAQFAGRQFSTVATRDDGLPSNKILALADGKSDGLWIGTDAGLCRWQEGQIAARYSVAEGLPSQVIQALTIDRRGTLWIGTARGLASLRDGQIVALAAESQPNESVKAIACSQSQVFVSYEDAGLFEILGSQLQKVHDTHGQLDVSACYGDPHGPLWMALRGRGLGQYVGGKLSVFGVKDGLFDDDIFGIASDDKGQLWMGCSRGIFSVPLADLDKLAAGKISRLSSTPFSPTDALRTIECRSGVQPAVWKMQDGCVWFSTIRGLIVIDPQRANRALPRPAVVIEEVRVNGVDVHPEAARSFPAGTKNLEFHYTALSLASPTRIAFQHKLDGYDTEWIPAGTRREAYYTNLSPGHYRFRVRATNADGAEEEAAQPVAFTLAPFFYQTRWFIPTIIAALGAVSWAGYRLRIRQIKMRLQAVMTERSRIARELHDTLIQGFSGVTMQLQALTTRMPPTPELETLREIITDAGNSLREARQTVAGLRAGPGTAVDLAAAIAQTARQLTDSSDVQVRLRLSSVRAAIGPQVQYNVLRIVQEAIANALKHSGATAIEVSLAATRNCLSISVQDNGSGFAAQQLDHAQAGHYGLIGMRERAAQIGAKIEWQSTRSGTTVILSCPVPNSLAE